MATRRGAFIFSKKNGRTTGRCPADDFRTGKCEMVLPLVLSWVEQFDCLIADFRGQVRPFGEIASVAGEREI